MHQKTKVFAMNKAEQPQCQDKQSSTTALYSSSVFAYCHGTQTSVIFFKSLGSGIGSALTTMRTSFRSSLTTSACGILAFSALSGLQFQTQAIELQLFAPAGGSSTTPNIVAGDPAGSPTDSPANRVDPNVTTSPFGGVGSFRVSIPGFGNFLGTGVPISRTHILTAAHLFDADSDGDSEAAPGGVSFSLNYSGNLSSTITASSIAIHPDYTGFNNPVVNDDLAIVTLSSPLPSGVPIYSLLGNPFLNVQEITLVGYGQSGNGNTGYTVNANRSIKRTGKNMAEVYAPDDEGSGSREVFYYDFDGPTPLSNIFGGLTLGNDLETVSGPGDSGGPSFVNSHGANTLFGINTFSSQVLGGPAVGHFGSLGGGIVVSAYRNWILGNAPTAVFVPDSTANLGLLALALSGLGLFNRPSKTTRSQVKGDH